MWSLAPAVLIVFGINLSDRHHVHYTLPAPSMVKCEAQKLRILGAMKASLRQRDGSPSLHMYVRCAKRWPMRKPAPLWRDT